MKSIKFGKRKYDVTSNCDDLEIEIIDQDRLRKICFFDKNEGENYKYAVKINGENQIIDEVRLNGKPLNAILDNEIYGLEDNVGGGIEVIAEKSYSYEIYDALSKQIVGIESVAAGEEVDLLNWMSDPGYDQTGATIINELTGKPLDKKDLKKYNYEFSFMESTETAVTSFVMPPFPIKIVYEYSQIKKQKVSLNLGCVENKLSTIKGLSSYLYNDTIYDLLSDLPKYYKEVKNLKIKLFTSEKIENKANDFLCLNVGNKKYKPESVNEKKSSGGVKYFEYKYDIKKLEGDLSLSFNLETEAKKVVAATTKPSHVVRPTMSARPTMSFISMQMAADEEETNDKKKKKK